jgi:steroid delta-isomerase-like uncharacterized protein
MKHLILLTLTIAPFMTIYSQNQKKSDPSNQKNAKLVRDFVETVKNQRQLEKLGDFFSADYVEHNATVASFGKGVEGYKVFLGHLFSAFPDDKLTIEQLVSEGDRVAYRATETGTHHAIFLGIPATGKQATWTEIQFFRIQDGKIVEHWVDVDIFSWFTQLGIIPPMGK